MPCYITKEDVITLLGKTKNTEIKGILLEYNNKNFDINESKDIQSNIDDRFTLDDYPKEKR